MIYKTIRFSHGETFLYRKTANGWQYLTPLGVWGGHPSPHTLKLLEGSITLDQYDLKHLLPITHIETITEDQMKATLWTL